MREAEAISHTRNHGLRNSRAEPSWLELDPPRIAPWHGQLSTRHAAACDFFRSSSLVSTIRNRYVVATGAIPRCASELSRDTLKCTRNVHEEVSGDRGSLNPISETNRALHVARYAEL